MGRRIVDKSIKKMAAPEHGNRIEWDAEIPGFGVRITASGVTSFILDYRIAGRQRRYTIGRYPELTVAAARIEGGNFGRGFDGHDPMEDRHQSRIEPTLGHLATEYLDRYAMPNKRPSSQRNDRQMIDNIIRPGIGKLRLKAVGRRDIEALHQSLRATPYVANRLLSLLSRMFNLGIQWKWTTDNPARGVPRFQEARRERWLTAKLRAQHWQLVELNNCVVRIALLQFVRQRLHPSGVSSEETWQADSLDHRPVLKIRVPEIEF